MGDITQSNILLSLYNTNWCFCIGIPNKMAKLKVIFHLVEWYCNCWMLDNVVVVAADSGFSVVKTRSSILMNICSMKSIDHFREEEEKNLCKCIQYEQHKNLILKPTSKFGFNIIVWVLWQYQSAIWKKIEVFCRLPFLFYFAILLYCCCSFCEVSDRTRHNSKQQTSNNRNWENSIHLSKYT